MNKPLTINGLMKHLRNDCDIHIHGTLQKQQLISYGYYHGYKGYRFYKNAESRIPYTNFSEVVSVIEYDNNMKSALYSHLMFIETAIKNIVCNTSIKGLKNATFDYVFKERMNDNTNNTKLQSDRLKLRNNVYSKLSTQYSKEEYNENKMVRHFYMRGEDVPIWVVFEILYLGDLATFFKCLNIASREQILKELNMLDISIDTNRNLLSEILFSLKALRNSVAHNNIIFDARFKDRNISGLMKKWLERETGINNITLYSLTDYIIVVCCMLKHVDFTRKRAYDLLNTYRLEIQKLKTNVTADIYDSIIQNNITQKISSLEDYLCS